MKECDLIMKGGLTSGVVYPKAITSLAKKYRFINIGGTSAGAIGAVIAAAAEFRRQSSDDKQSMDGFDHIDSIPSVLGPNLLDLFIPYPPLKAIFRTLIDLTRCDEDTNKLWIFLWGLIRHHPRTSLYVILMTLAVATLFIIQGQVGWACFTILSGMLIFALVIVCYLNIAVKAHLKENFFGLCTGTRPPKVQGGKLMSFLRKIYWKPKRQAKLAPFTDWMNEQIDQAAFGSIPTDSSIPLTIGDLRRHDIEIASMTTDLSSRRPYQLPFESRDHYFRKDEFERLFPRNIISYLLKDKVAVAFREDDKGNPHPDDPLDYYSLKISDEMPVLLIARMSLSFPGLISAVPLYRRDYELANSMEGYRPMKQCLFSDGGISSNFPVHFFDNWLPSRPTFGINLTKYHSDRHKSSSSESQESIEDRIELSIEPRSSRTMPIYPVTSLLGFLSSVVNTAKDWQDNLQGLLPGYSERIVDIRLSKDQGGMNLSMEDPEIKLLTRYGELAGKKLCDEFDFSEHRFRRAITSVPFLEESLSQFSEAFDNPDWDQSSDETWRGIFEIYEPKHYKGIPKNWRKNRLHKTAKEINSIGKTATEFESKFKLLRDKDKMPYVDAEIRLVASPARMRKERWQERRRKNNH